MDKFDKKFSIVGTIIILVIILFFCSFTTVSSGEVGLKVRFGKIVDTSITEGVHLKLPFIEKIVKVNIKVQKSELTVEGSTKDMQIINSTIAVNYHVDKDKASSLYKNVGKKYAETILDPAIKESIKTAIAQYNSEEITTKRGEVSTSCLDAIQNKVEKYGIIIDDFNLTDFSFSDEYTRAIESKQVAEQNLEKAKLDAEAKLIQAEANKKVNELLKQTLTKEILTEKFIEKWNGELPKVSSGDTLLDVSSILGGK